MSNLGPGFGGSWVFFDDNNRNLADITWDRVPLYYLKENQETNEISVFVTRLDE